MSKRLLHAFAIGASDGRAVTKTAVILVNLGAPDEQAAVRPFLQNMFGDRAILDMPAVARWFLARLIAARRAPIARANYAKIGGGSPLLANTLAQAHALEQCLGDNEAHKVFVCMRYWAPRSAEVATAVKAFDPDRIVLLPLYPQYSGTTTGSSIADWRKAAACAGIGAPTRVVCCYPDEEGWVTALAALTRPAHKAASTSGNPRILFSAHGLPKRTIESGDPYQWQIERTAAAVVEALGIEGLDWVVCYQSRVGPLQWTGPATAEEIARAAADGVPVVVVPIAFVSEHSETLVELDVDYRETAEALGIPVYIRVAAVGTHPCFIDALAALVERPVGPGRQVRAAAGHRICPAGHGRCAMAHQG
jgi:ferrochelatase